jgi:hypothetical protein
VDSNHRRSRTDRFTVCCRWPLGYPSEKEDYSLVLTLRAAQFVAGGGNRTRDLLITNQVLYQLSYTGSSPTSQPLNITHKTAASSTRRECSSQAKSADAAI